MLGCTSSQAPVVLANFQYQRRQLQSICSSSNHRGIPFDAAFVDLENNSLSHGELCVYCKQVPSVENL